MTKLLVKELTTEVFKVTTVDYADLREVDFEQERELLLVPEQDDGEIAKLLKGERYQEEVKLLLGAIEYNSVRETHLKRKNKI